MNFFLLKESISEQLIQNVYYFTTQTKQAIIYFFAPGYAEAGAPLPGFGYGVPGPLG